MNDIDSLSRSAISDLLDKLTRDTNAAAPSLLRSFPIRDYITKLDKIDGFRGYHFIAHAMEGLTSSILNHSNPTNLECYHKLVLVTLIQDFELRTSSQKIPDSVYKLYAVEFKRIIFEFESNTEGHYVLDNDIFLKDLCICANRMHPCGAELVEVSAGIPRSLLIRAGLAQFLRGLAFFSFRVRGFMPLYSLHMHPRSLAEFNPDGWDRTYVRIAELLELNPSVKGVFGTAWFNDPVLEHVSPHLSYIRRRREENGAQNFRFGSTTDSIDDALSTSQKRRQLYEQGKYTPTSYYLVWARRDLISWARRN